MILFLCVLKKPSLKANLLSFPSQRLNMISNTVCQRHHISASRIHLIPYTKPAVLKVFHIEDHKLAQNRPNTPI